MSDGGHLLASPWTFYGVNKKSVETSYEKSIHQICKVHTVEAFWAIYSRMRRAPELTKSDAIHFFRGDNRAVWEDPVHSGGGRVEFNFAARSADRAALVWEKLLLTFIGENASAAFLGATLMLYVHQRGGGTRIDVWCGAIENPREAIADLAKLLDLPLKSEIRWREHGSRPAKALSFRLEGDGPAQIQGG